MIDFSAIDWNSVRQVIRERPTAPNRPRFDPALLEIERQRLVRKLISRKQEGLALYEPVMLGDALHRSTAQRKIADGSNRACKTTTCAAEAAYAFTGTHPHRQYVKKNGLAWCVGLKEKHLILMYDALFKEGAFMTIQDEQTKLMRAVRWDRSNPTQLQPYDAAYREKWKPAPPLIPKRMYTEAMLDKGKGIPGIHNFKNGWKVIWSSGMGVSEQGQHWNFVWFDEEMDDPEFYKEAHRGTTRTYETDIERPRLVWSATSQACNPELAELREKAEVDPESPFVRRFVFLIKNNPYITQEDRKTFAEGYSYDDQLIRIHGVPSASSLRIYPTYDPMGPHGCEPFDIPKDWCHWFVTDPGRSHCATIFPTIDPDQQFMTVTGGFDLRNSDAPTWAAMVRKQEIINGKRFEGAIFDKQRGTQRQDALFSKTVAEQYWEALIAAGVEPRTKGSMPGMGGFWPSCNDVEAREKALIGMLTIRNDGAFTGTSKLRVVRGAVPELDKQIKQAHMDRSNPEKRYKDKSQPSDFIECLEYAAAFNPGYHPPELPPAAPVNAALEAFKTKQRDKVRRQIASLHSY
jgi:hypothetical protein